MSTNQFVLHCAFHIALQCRFYVASAKTKGRASSDRRIFPNARFDFQISIICEHSRAEARHGANYLSTALDASVSSLRQWECNERAPLLTPSI
jgi:hypothetical protein